MIIALTTTIVGTRSILYGVTMARYSIKRRCGICACSGSSLDPTASFRAHSVWSPLWPVTMHWIRYCERRRLEPKYLASLVVGVGGGGLGAGADAGLGERTLENWGGGGRTELPSPRPLPFLHLYSPQTKPPPPRPKQLFWFSCNQSIRNGRGSTGQSLVVECGLHCALTFKA